MNSTTKFRREMLKIIIVSCVVVTACNRTSREQPRQDTAHPPVSTKSEPRIHQKSVEAMGTVFNFTIAAAPGRSGVEKATDAAFEEIQRIENMMTPHRESSALSRINQAAGKTPVAAPPELIELITRALKISNMTKGKFDITFGAVGKLWRFRDPAPEPPSTADIKSQLPLLNYRNVVIDKNAQTIMLKTPGMSVGLGAMAKGYAVDRAAEILRSKGFDDFIVYGGGDIYVSGKKGGRPWRLGIQDPRNRERYFADFSLAEGGAVVTSGDYEKFFFSNGKRYHHIIDPDTGYPAQGTVSVTVVTDRAAEADALATGIFVLGPDKGMALIESTPNLEGVIVDSTLTPRVSSGLKARVTMRPIASPDRKAKE